MAERQRLAAEVVARNGTGTTAQLVVDDECVCLSASLGASRLLGRSREELIGRPLPELFEHAAAERFEHVWRAFRDSGGEAAAFTLRPPASAAAVAVTVTPALLEGRHLLRLEPIFQTEIKLPPRRPAAAREPSARECQVLELLAAGATDAQIAAKLDLSPATVQTHVRNAKAKLGARTRAQAVAIAIQRRLIPA